MYGDGPLMAKLLPKADLEALSICGVEKALYMGDTPAARSTANESFAKIRLRLNDGCATRVPSGSLQVPIGGAALPPVHFTSVVSGLCHTPRAARRVLREAFRELRRDFGNPIAIAFCRDALPQADQRRAVK
jgi:hypothetical protein